jgi:ABC-2 type transport system ATP-binding protein
MIHINDIEVRYGEQIALRIITPIKIEEGDRVGIIGSNGAGKTTLINSILGLIPYNGSIRTKVKPNEMSVHMQKNEYAGTVPIRYIIEALLNTSIRKDKKLSELINFFNFKGCLNKKFNALSGGEKQRLTIIMVLIQNTSLVFFDEVTTGLDFETRQQLMERIGTWYKKKNTTVLIVSHYYEELEQLVNKIMILEKGQIVAFGNKEELFNKYCGRSIITVENNSYNNKILKDYSKIFAPKHLLAFPLKEENEEIGLIRLLIENNINFKRSNNDIEIMSINAKMDFNSKKDGGNVREENL